MPRQAAVCTAACAALALTSAVAAEAPPAGYWRVEPASSALRVLVFRGGLLGALGHNHVVTHRAMSGCAALADEVAASRFRLTLPVRAFEVDNDADRRAAGERFPVPVPADDIAATRRNMLGPRLLDAGRHDDIVLAAETFRGEWPTLEAELAIDIAGQRRRLSLPVTLSRDGERLAATGSWEVSHAELGLKPFSAALGTLRVADRLELRYEFTLTASPAVEAASDCERALAVVDDDGTAAAHDAPE